MASSDTTGQSGYQVKPVMSYQMLMAGMKVFENKLMRWSGESWQLTVCFNLQNILLLVLDMSWDKNLIVVTWDWKTRNGGINMNLAWDYQHFHHSQHVKDLLTTDIEQMNQVCVWEDFEGNVPRWSLKELQSCTIVIQIDNVPEKIAPEHTQIQAWLLITCKMCRFTSPLWVSVTTIRLA